GDLEWRAAGRSVADQRHPARPAHHGPVPWRVAGGVAGVVGQHRLLRHRQPAESVEQGNPDRRPRAGGNHYRLRRQPPGRQLAAPALRHTTRNAAVPGGVPLSADSTRASREQAHCAAGGRRTPDRTSRRHLPGPGYRALRAAGQTGRRARRCPRARHRAAAGP
nr:hypothetical protein [Tanacetum cinerariifolium]